MSHGGGFTKSGGGTRFFTEPTRWETEGLVMVCDPHGSLLYLTMTVDSDGRTQTFRRHDQADWTGEEERLDAIFGVLACANAGYVVGYLRVSGWAEEEEHHHHGHHDHGGCCGNWTAHAHPGLHVGLIDGMPCVARIEFPCQSHVGCHEAFEHNPATGRCRHKREDGTCVAAERLVSYCRANGNNAFPWSSRGREPSVFEG